MIIRFEKPKEVVEVRDLEPFNEVIVSWNGKRPKVGSWSFWVSLYQEGWSEWLKLAEWGEGTQRTFHSESDVAKTYQDIARPLKGHCTGFRVRVQAEKGAKLSSLQAISVCCSDLDLIEPLKLSMPSVLLTDFPRQSQRLLPHHRALDLCSPTSTATAVSYLRGEWVDPVLFAEQAHDKGFDIFGNWILNTAAAAEYLFPKYRTYVERLPDFGSIHRRLSQGMPVVVSVKGPLSGAPMPYTHGHLLCVIGYRKGKVLCMDPGFDSHEKTFVSYELDDFIEAWTVRRKNLAYIFETGGSLSK
jgi:hypothetical protein